MFIKFARDRNSRKRQTKLAGTCVRGAERKIPIVNEEPRDRNNFRITKQRSAPVDRDRRRGKKHGICVRARTVPPPLRTCMYPVQCRVVAPLRGGRALPLSGRIPAADGY